ncbi:MAG: DUF1674 domain-containing protein [Salinisphaeraceae bacterium]|nr:DUF1674 domain-containing protein [Salinisphaeraceae bacterium]
MSASDNPRNQSESSHPGEQDVSIDDAVDKRQDTSVRRKEFGGPKGPEPTRYGDWEKQGRCIDF